MKKTLLLIVALVFAIGTYAQNGTAPLAKGDKQLNFGLGFSDNGLPVYVSFDFAVHRNVTITPEVHIVFDNNTRFGALVKADYHWNYLMGIPSDWDFYTGGRLGFISGDNFDLDLGIQVGGRWYWNSKWGLNFELAGGTGFGTTLGVSMKL
jgi:hypothetical protein